LRKNKKKNKKYLTRFIDSCYKFNKDEGVWLSLIAAFVNRFAGENISGGEWRGTKQETVYPEN